VNAAFLIFIFRTTSAGSQVWGETKSIFRDATEDLTLCKGPWDEKTEAAQGKLTTNF
jgi:hypothetical protein